MTLPKEKPGLDASAASHRPGRTLANRLESLGFVCGKAKQVFGFIGFADISMINTDLMNNDTRTSFDGSVAPTDKRFGTCSPGGYHE